MEINYNYWIVFATGTALGLALTFAIAWMAGRGNIVTRMLLRMGAAFFLMVPVYSVLGETTREWFMPYNNGWATFEPWADSLIGTFIAISFVLAVVVSFIIERLFRLMLPQRNATTSSV